MKRHLQMMIIADKSHPWTGMEKTGGEAHCLELIAGREEAHPRSIS